MASSTQAFTQSDAQITAQNLDHVLTFAGDKARQTILQCIFFRRRAAQLVELFKEFIRINQTEGFRSCPAIEHFERRLARVTMAGSDATKFCFAHLRGAGECAVNNRAADLQRAQIRLRKSVPGKIDSGDR